MVDNKENYYKWHDLRIDSTDLPHKEEDVLIISNVGKYQIANYWDGVFVIPNKKDGEQVIAWKYLETFIKPTGNCKTCKHCIPCKQLVDGKWKNFKICKLFANEPDGWSIVVTEEDTCECFLHK